MARSRAVGRDGSETLKGNTVSPKGVTLRAAEQPIDTSTPAAKAFLDMLGVFAEFETTIRKERLEGIAKAKANGIYKGRKPTIDMAHIHSA
jgi:DNA invertase Pin-like site-specific DNA recombinase